MSGSADAFLVFLEQPITMLTYRMHLFLGVDGAAWWFVYNASLNILSDIYFSIADQVHGRL